MLDLLGLGESYTRSELESSLKGYVLEDSNENINDSQSNITLYDIYHSKNAFKY